MPAIYRQGDRPVPGHTLLEFLGEGGFGEVWKALNPSKIEVALKIVSLQGKQSLREVFAIRMIRNVRHPNLIPIFGFWLKDQEGNIMENAAEESMSGFLLEGDFQFILAMGLAERSLIDRLNECKKENFPGIPQDELLQYMEEAARALDFLNSPRHNMGKNDKASIEHCDIKPQNLLLVGESVQICDFGLARVQQHGVKQTHSVHFSHHYVAPELLRKEMGPCRTTDQYSLAISYVHLRTGRLPFSDVNFAPAILTAHLEGNLDFSFLAHREQTVLRKATSLNPDDRFPSSRAFVESLKEAIGSATKTTKPVAPGPRGPLRPGAEIVPGYKLDELIGRGSFGEVWRATAPGRLKKAVKVIRNLDLASSRQEMRSLELITEVRHPHLLQIEAYFLLDAQGEMIPDEEREGKNPPKADTLVIVTELAESHLGRRLQQCYQQNGQGIPPTELLAYVQHIASALDRLNTEHDVIHRDVKPENILLVGGVAKLADFGLAKVLEGSSAMVHTKSIGMTPAYAAPELCNSRIEKATDQYSLALTYYHLRTGELATGNASDLSELIKAHLDNKLNFSLVPPAEEKVLRRGAARESKNRYPSCSAFAQALAATFSQGHSQKQGHRQSDPLEMPALGHISPPGTDTSVEWAEEEDEVAVAVKSETERKQTDTVAKLTDTSKEKAGQGQKTTQKRKDSTTKVIPKTKSVRPRKKSVAARIFATLLVLIIVGGGIAGFLYYGYKRLPDQAKSTVPDPTVPKDDPPKKGNDNKNENDKTKENDKDNTKKQPIDDKKKDLDKKELILTVDELLKKAKDSLGNKQPSAAVPDLIELAKRIGPAGSEPDKQSALLLAAQTFDQIPEAEKSARQRLLDAYRPWASQFFEDRTKQKLLRDDVKQINWKQWSQLEALADPASTWVIVFQIEEMLHRPALDKKATEELGSALKQLELQPASLLGVYGQYLRGASHWRLQDTAKATDLFLALDPKNTELQWGARAPVISAALLAAYPQRKQSALQPGDWQKPFVSPEAAQTLGTFIEKLQQWDRKSLPPEDQVIFFLTQAVQKIQPEQTKSLLTLSKQQKLDQVGGLAPALELAFLANYLQLSLQAKEPSKEWLPLGHRFIAALQKLPSVSSEDLYQRLDGIVENVGTLSALTEMAQPQREQLIFLFATRGKLLLDNSYSTWHGKPNALETAHDDFDTAIKLSMMSNLQSKDLVGNTVWLAATKQALNRSGWQQLIVKLNETELEAVQRPYVWFLKGIVGLENARKTESTKERLPLDLEAKSLLSKAIEEWEKSAEPSGLFVNEARIECSAVCLDYASHLDLSNENDLRQQRQQYLDRAEQYAEKAAKDQHIGQKKPRAFFAWGDAIEASCLLLARNRYSQAIEHFSVAINSWRGKPECAPVLVHRARSRFRTKDTSVDHLILQDLVDALKLVSQGDLAAEAHYWRGKLAHRKKNLSEAQTEFVSARSKAKNKFLKDTAALASGWLLLDLPVDNSSKDSLLEHIIKLMLAEQSLSKMDTRLKKESDELRIHLLNELGDLEYKATFLDTREAQQKHLNKVLEHSSLLRSSEQLVAKLWGTRHKARVQLARGERVAAYASCEMDGQLVKTLELLKERTAPAELKAAFLSLLDIRFEIFSEYLSKTQHIDVFHKNAYKDVALAHSALALTQPKDDYHAVMLGHIGLLHRTIGRNEIQDNGKFDKDVQEKEMVKHLTAALADSQKSRMAWKWTYALGDYELEKGSKEKAAKYFDQTKVLVNGLSAWDISNIYREKVLENLKGKIKD